jgi:nucleoside-triphosphatase
VGKTTCIERLLERLEAQAFGFFTREVRLEGRRVGFDIETLDGRRGILARDGLESPYRVGRYGVDLESFESLALPALEEGLEKGRLLIIDEIGKMELYSRAFRGLVERAFAGPNPVVATIMIGNPPFIRRLKAHPQARLIEVTRSNREAIPARVASWLEPFL